MYKLFVAFVMAFGLMFAPALAAEGFGGKDVIGPRLVQVEASQCKANKLIGSVSAELTEAGLNHIVVTGSALDDVAAALASKIGPKPASIHGMIFVEVDPDNPQKGGGVAFFNENMCLMNVVVWPADLVNKAFDTFRGV